MQRWRSLLTLLLAAILLGKAVAGAAFPLLGVPGHHAIGSTGACAVTVFASTPHGHAADAGAAAGPEANADRLHRGAVHDHSCPQLCMSGIDTPVFIWTASAPPAEAVTPAPAPSASHLVSPLLHPPRARISAQ